MSTPPTDPPPHATAATPASRPQGRPAEEAQVRAAGGVVWREGPDGVQVLVIHRPRYDDWSLPKGKLDDGESFEDAAVREIAEETGVVGALGADLGEVRYTDSRGRSKVVRWWAVQAPPDGAVAQPDGVEVDLLRWLPLGDVPEVLTYPTDVQVLERFRASVVR